MTQPVINLQSIFVNGASLEVPDRARMFGLTGEHPVNINISAAHRQLDKTVYEVSVKVLVDAKHQDKDLYVVELVQTAVFNIEADADDVLSQILYVACPSIVVPYLRANFADLLLRANLPIMHIPDVNWTVPTQAPASDTPAAKPANAPLVH